MFIAATADDASPDRARHGMQFLNLSSVDKDVIQTGIRNRISHGITLESPENAK